MKTLSTIRAAALAATTVWTLACASLVQAQHVDILVSQDQAVGGKLVIGGYDDGLPGVDNPGPVGVFGFDAEFDGAGSPYFGNGEPGFRARKTAELTPLFGLPGGEDLGFSFQTFTMSANAANLWYWDGSGSPNFSPSVGHQLKLKKGASDSTVTGAEMDVSGFTIATTSTIDPNPGIGTIHQHIDTYISQGVSGEPTNLGIYLVGLEFTLTGGHTPSDLTYLVFATIDEEGLITEEMHDSAIDWVQENLFEAQPEAVPEPSSILLCGAAGGVGLMVWAIRRRR